MVQVTLIGGGNVAHHLGKALLDTEEFVLSQWYNRSVEKLQPFAAHTEIIDTIEKLKPADVYIVAVSDTAIDEILTNVQHLQGLWLHTSGAVSIDVFRNFPNAGVLYPLQTFTKSRNLNFSKIPLCVEIKDNTDLPLLELLARSLSNEVYQIHSEQRKELHLAAVFVNNFTNYMYHIGETICKQHEIPFRVLHPIIEETSKKIKSLSAFDAQTGPARRNDTPTMQTHLSSLNAKNSEIYTLLSNAIIDTYKNGEKL